MSVESDTATRNLNSWT